VDGGLKAHQHKKEQAISGKIPKGEYMGRRKSLGRKGGDKNLLGVVSSGTLSYEKLPKGVTQKGE